MAATREQLVQALRNADAAGDAEGATELARRISALPPPQTMGDKVLEAGGNFAKGVVGSVGSLGSNIINLQTAAPRALVRTLGGGDNPVSQYIERMPDAAKQMRSDAKGAAGFAGELVGDVAGTAGIGGVGLKAAQFLPMAQRAVRPVIAAMGTGAAGGAMTAPTDHAKSAAIGAVGGAVGQQVLSRVLSRLANPLRSVHHADSDALMQGGVPLTAGMAADPNSWAGRLVRFVEESAASVPGLGAGVKAQRDAARAGFRDMPLREMTENAGVPMPARAGDRTFADMLDQVHTDVGHRYDQLLGGRAIRPTAVLKRALDTIVLDPARGMTEAARQQARNLIEAHIYGRAKDPATGLLPPTMDVPALFRAQSDLRQLGNKAQRSDLIDENVKGGALTSAADEVYNFISRRFPRVGQELNDLRAPYARLSTLDAAANKAGSRGEFTPEQLGRVAIKRGDEEMRHLAAMAEPLITKDPGGLGAAARTALLTGSSALVGPASIPMGILAHTLLGTKTGQGALTGRLGIQQRLADLLTRRAGSINEAGAIAGREAALEAQ